MAGNEVMTTTTTDGDGDHDHRARAPALRGRGLRFVLVDQLGHHGTMTVAEMVIALDGYGFDLGGRASKVISDALRWEVARGRVRRLRRGVYAIGRAPASTARRIRLFARQCIAWMLATGRGETPPPTPTTPPHRRVTPWRPEHPYRAPWDNLYWLWSC